MTLPADRILLGAPIWAIGLTLFVLLIGMMLLGIAVRRRTERRAASEGEDAQEGYIVSGALGLLALLLGFTFAMAVDRYDNRRSLVLEEANAIGTTYLRAQLLDEPFRSRLSRLLEGYTASRIRLATADSREQRAPLMARSDDYQQPMWTETVAVGRPSAGIPGGNGGFAEYDAQEPAGALRHACPATRARFPARLAVPRRRPGPRSRRLQAVALEPGERRAWAPAFAGEQRVGTVEYRARASTPPRCGFPPMGRAGAVS